MKMTNKEIIYKFLDKNCSLHFVDAPIHFESTPLVRDKITSKTNYDSASYLVNVLVKIFPDDMYNTESIFFTWFEEEVDKMNVELTAFYKNFDIKKGIVKLIEAGLTEFKDSPTIGKDYIVGRFSNMYIRTIMPSMEKNIKKYSNLDCTNLTKRIIKKYKAFNEITAGYIKDNVIAYYKKNIIPYKINEYLENLDLNLGSKRLITDLSIEFKEDKKYFEGTIMDTFKNYYRTNHLDVKLNNFLSSKTHANVFSLDHLKNQYGDLNLEFEAEATYAENILNEWYLENRLKDKLDDFFSQLIITMGARNWMVTWIGHGPITENSIMSAIKEDKTNEKYILEKYDKWYGEAVLEASERLISRNRGHDYWVR